MLVQRCKCRIAARCLCTYRFISVRAMACQAITRSNKLSHATAVQRHAYLSMSTCDGHSHTMSAKNSLEKLTNTPHGPTNEEGDKENGNNKRTINTRVLAETYESGRRNSGKAGVACVAIGCAMHGKRDAQMAVLAFPAGVVTPPFPNRHKQRVMCSVRFEWPILSKITDSMSGNCILIAQKYRMKSRRNVNVMQYKQ